MIEMVHKVMHRMAMVLMPQVHHTVFSAVSLINRLNLMCVRFDTPPKEPNNFWRWGLSETIEKFSPIGAYPVLVTIIEYIFSTMFATSFELIE